MEYRLRPGNACDVPFLKRMLREAVYWESKASKPSMAECLRNPQIAMMVRDWGRKGDTAFIAETNGGRPIGAAWYRFFFKESHSYGFVAEDLPEIAIAVAESSRRAGVGSALLRKLVAEAKKKGYRGLSLSVARDNFAAMWYKKCGFVRLNEERELYWTMVLDITGEIR